MTATRTELVEAAARLAALGLSPGSSGNVSLREGDTIAMSPTGADLAALDPARLSVLDDDGTLLDGPRASKEFPLHRAFYRRDPEFAAIVHLHSAHASAVSCLEAWSPRSALPPITPYFVMRVGQTPLVPYADPGDPAQAGQLEALALPFRAALLANHGLVVAGRTVAEALDAAIELEEACKLLLLLGDRPIRTLGESDALRLAERYGSPWGD
ncbi:class II aldolase/adducin family protein [Prauserella cavernicola]|uniref:Class II aldolase/adducin family protein n=1 Tax=Prauserella cavernicola TaxID=2800127 RepID=A0A934QYR6_9PSEU|nr:class II aldolase/adducin family protein [Prauserella cavernicola]MBK1787733.1 class II aldolase/adducin family protein [Prauserella cavernicola]